MYDFLADFSFVRSLWEESSEDRHGPARRFAEANSNSSFAISLFTSLRLAAYAKLHDEEQVVRMLQAFPVVAIEPPVIARAADLLNFNDISPEFALECALALVLEMKVLTAKPELFSFLPKLTVIPFMDNEV